MTHPTDRDEDYQRRTDAIKAVLLRNWPTMCDDGYDLGAVAHDLFLAVTPLPAAPAHDAVREARERFTEAGRRYCEAVNDDALVLQRVERWHEWNRAHTALLAAERAASDDKGGGK